MSTEHLSFASYLVSVTDTWSEQERSKLTWVLRSSDDSIYLEQPPLWLSVDRNFLVGLDEETVKKFQREYIDTKIRPLFGEGPSERLSEAFRYGSLDPFLQQLLEGAQSVQDADTLITQCRKVKNDEFSRPPRLLYPYFAPRSMKMAPCFSYCTLEFWFDLEELERLREGAIRAWATELKERLRLG